MPLLLLTPREDIQDTFVLSKAANRLNWSVERATSYQPANAKYPNREVVLYGETLFTTLAARSLGYEVLEPDFDMLARFPEIYLSRDVRQMTLGEAQKLDKPFFAKPADGNKLFESQVYCDGTELPSRFVSKSLPVLTSTPVEWTVEYRFFVLEGNIATFSIYARFGEIAKNADGNWDISVSEQEDAIKFCEAILSDNSIELPPAVVLDVGIIKSQGWALIEPNPVSSSGIYGCDPDRVLSVLHRACAPKDKLSDADKRWVVNRPI